MVSSFGSLWDELTPSERRIYSALAEGLTDTEIADRLRISVRSVSNRLYSLYQKGGFSGARAAIVFYYRNGGKRWSSLGFVSVVI
jgi:DNA-binding CsgD family transcriptional regulator